MKKVTFVLTAFCLLVAVSLLSSCGINGKGEVVSKSFEVAPFTGVTNGIAADIHLTQAATQSVEVVAQQNIINNLSLEVEDGILNIEFIKKNVRHYEPININITLPVLSSLNISGSGNMNLTNTFDSCSSVSLNISGSGNIDAGFNASAKTYSTISGSGDINLSGFSPAHDITISGSGSIHAFPFHTYSTSVNISGSGSCELWADSTLSVVISGSGNVYYKGYPAISTTISGSGNVSNSN